MAAGQTAYESLTGELGSLRFRWGDWNTAVADGNHVWFGTEYIGNDGACTPTQWLTDFLNDAFSNPPALLACGGTRTLDYNWNTRISEVTLGQ
jgi:hypothetical protein